MLHYLRHFLVAFLFVVNLCLVGLCQIDVENLKKTIDIQQEMIYNKDNQILELETRIAELDKSLIESIKEREELEQQIVQKSLNTRIFKITHYSAEETGTSMTASGRIAQENHTIACNSLPMFTRVKINGQIYTVEDTGGMADDVIDIFVGDGEDIDSLGIYEAEVEIL